MKTRLLLLATLAMACATPTPGVTYIAGGGSPLVTIEAGVASFGGGVGVPAKYVIDTRTQTCWFHFYAAVSPMRCCDLRRVAEAAPHMPWLTDASCQVSTTGP